MVAMTVALESSCQVCSVLSTDQSRFAAQHEPTVWLVHCSVQTLCAPLCVSRLVESCATKCSVEESRTLLLRRWLELELATAGNVTCLVGTPGDPWYPPCVELVEQRAAGEGQKVGGARAG